MSQSTLEKAQRVIAKFHDSDRIVDLEAFESGAGADGNDMMLGPRLERAAMNHSEDGAATITRYAIWAETVRGLVLTSLADVESGRINPQTKDCLIKAANSLAAFSEIQRIFDAED